MLHPLVMPSTLQHWTDQRYTRDHMQQYPLFLFKARHRRKVVRFVRALCPDKVGPTAGQRRASRRRARCEATTQESAERNQRALRHAALSKSFSFPCWPMMTCSYGHVLKLLLLTLLLGSASSCLATCALVTRGQISISRSLYSAHRLALDNLFIGFPLCLSIMQNQTSTGIAFGVLWASNAEGYQRSTPKYEA